MELLERSKHRGNISGAPGRRPVGVREVREHQERLLVVDPADELGRHRNIGRVDALLYLQPAGAGIVESLLDEDLPAVS